MGRLLFIALLVPLAACAGAEGEGATRNQGPGEGTIRTGEDLTMVPLEQRDADGCQGYRQYSPVHLVTMAIYYRDAEGGFTANKLAAACRTEKRPE